MVISQGGIMKNKIFVMITILAVVVTLSACGGKAKLKDGVYEAESSKDDSGGYATVKLVVKNGEIDNVQYNSFQKDGKLKDENYGKSAGNDAFFEKAQIAVKGIKSYQEQINEVKDINKVEVVSGATISYNQFMETMKKALDKAK